MHTLTQGSVSRTVDPATRNARPEQDGRGKTRRNDRVREWRFGFAFWLGCVFVTAHLLLAIGGQWVATYSPTEFSYGEMLQAPSMKHLFGTDQFGRDIFSRVVYGGRVILLVGLLVTVCSVGLGMLVGLCSGYIGGWVDEITMRLMDAAMAIPTLLLALLILTTLGAGLLNLVVGITAVFIPRVARVVRSGVLGIRELGYIEAARLRGESTGYILGREILPNIWNILVVEASLRFGYAILLGASLGFLGSGIQPPTPDWGLMISEARNLLGYAWWTTAFPSLAIMTLVVGVNLLSDALSHASNREGSRSVT